MIVYTDDTAIMIEPNDTGIEVRMASGMNLVSTTFNRDQYTALFWGLFKSATQAFPDQYGYEEDDKPCKRS